MPVKTKHIVVGGLVIAGCFGTAFAYWQYKKITDTGVKFKGLKIKSLSLAKVNFDVTVGINNQSKLTFTVRHQKYKLYINNIFITEVNAPAEQEIKAGTESNMTFNVNISPLQLSQAKVTGADLMKGKDIPVRIDMKIGVTFLRVPFNIPYTYATTIGDLFAQ